MFTLTQTPNLHSCTTLEFPSYAYKALKKLWTNSNDTWWTHWVFHKEEMTRFWWRFRSGYENFLSDSSPLRDRMKLICSTISQKVVDRFGSNLVDRLGVGQGRIDSILVKICIVFIRNDTVLYSMIFQKCIGPDMFSRMRHYVVEVCAPPSAHLVKYWDAS